MLGDGETNLEQGDKFSILSTDRTRTSILTINDITFDDSSVYECVASFTFPGTFAETETRTYSVQFPGKNGGINNYGYCDFLIGMIDPLLKYPFLSSAVKGWPD